MKDLITIYLAGACKNEPDEGKEWRRSAKRAFNNISKYQGVKSCVVDPTDYFSYSNPIHKSDKQVKAYYMSRIKNSDVMLLNLSGSESSVGTGQEAQFAVDHNIPIIGFINGNDTSYPWIKNVDCDVVFDNMEEAIEYIEHYYMIA